MKKILFTSRQDFFPVTCKAGFPSNCMHGHPSNRLLYSCIMSTRRVVFSVTGSTSQKLQHSLTECSSCPSFFPAVTHALACKKRALSERNTCLHWSQFDDLHHAYRNPTIAVEDHQQFMLDGKARQKRGARLFASLNKLELQSELQARVQNHTFSAPEVFNHTDEIHIK